MIARRVFALALLLLLGAAQAEVPVPALQARVTDLTNTLAPAQRQTLEQKLAAFEREKGSQVAVLLVPTTQPETIEQYSIRVAERWQLGRERPDDGVLLLVAKNDRALRLEVGYGLEGAIPDAIAKRVIEETILPRFRAGDLAGGIDAGVDQVLGLIRGEALPPPPQPVRGSRADGLEAAGPLLIVALLVGQMLRALLGPLLAGLLVGGGLFALVALFSGGAALGLMLGLLGFVFTVTGMMSRGRGWASGGGGLRGGGFGGGGFRGGGGGFGGGGASGRW